MFLKWLIKISKSQSCRLMASWLQRYSLCLSLHYGVHYDVIIATVQFVPSPASWRSLWRHHCDVTVCAFPYIMAFTMTSWLWRYSLCLPLHHGVHVRLDRDSAHHQRQSRPHHDHARPDARHLQGMMTSHAHHVCLSKCYYQHERL